MKRGDYLTLRDLSTEQVHRLLSCARELKANRVMSTALAGQSLAIVFQKPSLRTRTSFDVAAFELGGHAIYLGPDEIGLGKRESIPDIARVLSQYVHGIVARTFRHEDQLLLAGHATVPVINALSDFDHPCQGLADLFTLQEHCGRLSGLRLAYIGDGNNVARTLIFASAKVGLRLTIASPPGYACEPDLVETCHVEAQRNGGSITLTTDPHVAAEGADALYTDVWTSMGQESQTDERRRIFGHYQINQDLVRLAGSSALVMHDLPAHRGEEITDDVMDGPRSVVFKQAANRLHVQKAILLWLMGPAEAELP